MDHDLEYPVEHPAGNDVAELIVQLWDVPALSAQDFHETLGGFHFDLYHAVDKVFVSSALGLADQQSERVKMLVHIAQHFLYAITGFYPYMAGLFRLRQFGERRLCPHEHSHDRRRMRFYQGGEQGLLAGVVPVKGSGRHSGILDDLSQGGVRKALFQKFLHCRLMDTG